MQKLHDIKTPVQLYRHLCRRVRELPLPVQPYYKHHIRQVVHAHTCSLYHVPPPPVTIDCDWTCKVTISNKIWPEKLTQLKGGSSVST